MSLRRHDWELPSRLETGMPWEQHVRFSLQCIVALLADGLAPPATTLSRPSSKN